MRSKYFSINAINVSLPLIIIVCLFMCCFTQPVRADIVADGDVAPADPATWTSNTYGSIGINGEGFLDITGGGTVSSRSGRIGFGVGSIGVVTVDGVGSTWTNSDELRIGRYGSGTLDITDGGAVSSETAFIGDESGSTGAVTVDGIGSTWTNSGYLYVGLYGSGTLDITGGGMVTVEETTWVTRLPGSSGVINFDNGTLTTGGLACAVENLTGEGIINTSGLVSDVDLIFDAENGLNQTFIINENAGQDITVNLNVDGSGLLGAGYSTAGKMSIFDGIEVASTYGYIGYKSGSTGAVTVDGVGSMWTNRNNLSVGYAGSGTLDITGGGTVSNDSGYIGSGSTGAVTVDGVGSMWTNNRDLRVGGSGIGTLDITGGGTVSNDSGYIGSGSTGAVTVNGAGSMWTNRGRLYVHGTLDVTGGGTVSSSDGYIDNISGTTGVITVCGAGSAWNNLDSLHVGNYGSGSLNITGGGTVSSYRDVDIGYWAGSVGVVTVDGVGSSWAGSNGLRIGRSGNGTLIINDGGAVSNGYGYVGYESGSTGVVTVDGIGSAWVNSGHLYVGDSGSGTLNITGGGTVAVGGDTWVARYSGSSGMVNFNNGTLSTGGFICAADNLTGTGTINASGLVSDVDMVFNSVHGTNQTFSINENAGQDITVNLNIDGSGSMGAGHSGSGTMSISDGINIASTKGYIGYESGSIGVVTVDGANSRWTNSNKMYIGYSGNGTLDITGGGAINNVHGCIGYNSGAAGVVTIDGVDSMWTNSNDLRVGYYGSGTLNITDGGMVSVSNGNALIGREFGSTGAVTIDGVGSMWTNSGNIYVGYFGSGTLDITGGGALNNVYGVIGSRSGSTGTVTVDGVGSMWTNSSGLFVGNYGIGTLDITGCGLVSVGGGLAIDAKGYGVSFVNMASGGMLALMGEAEESLVEFLGLVDGTDAIRYWDASILDWADITGATFGDDYMLDYIVDGGDLDGYTVLTVNTVPEPCSLVLLGLGGLVLCRRRG